MMWGDFPPSSSVTVFRLVADICTISRPVTYSPVKAIVSTAGGPVAGDLGRERAHAARHEDRHAHVERLEAAEVGGIRLEQVGEPTEEAGALPGRRAGPRALVGGARSPDGGVDVGLVALGDDRDHGAVVRADALEALAGTAVAELAVDEKLIPPCAALGAEGLGAACHVRPPSERPT